MAAVKVIAFIGVFLSLATFEVTAIKASSPLGELSKITRQLVNSDLFNSSSSRQSERVVKSTANLLHGLIHFLTTASGCQFIKFSTSGLFIAGQTVELWASSVVAFSSQYNAAYAATSVIGEPNVYPRYGDIPGAWAHRKTYSTAEYIVMRFAEQLFIQSVMIYETFNAGAVVRISVRDPGTGLWVTRWQAPNNMPQHITSSRCFSPLLTEMNFASDVVKIDIDCRHATWCEIDAIKIRGQRVTCPETQSLSVLSGNIRQLVNGDVFSELSQCTGGGSDISGIVRSTTVLITNIATFIDIDRPVVAGVQKVGCLRVQSRCQVGTVLVEGKRLQCPGAWTPTTEFSKSLRQLLVGGAFSDVRFTVEGRSVLGHRSILSTRSAFFRQLFDKSPNTTSCQDSSTDQLIAIGNLSYSTFLAMMQFIYTNSLDDAVSATDLVKLISASDRFSLDELKTLSYCQLCSELAVDNVIAVYQLAVADQHRRLVAVKQLALGYVANNVDNVVKHESFLNLPSATRENVLNEAAAIC